MTITYNVHLNDNGAKLSYSAGLAYNDALREAARLARVTIPTIKRRITRWQGADNSMQVGGREVGACGVWIEEDYDPRDEYARD